MLARKIRWLVPVVCLLLLGCGAGHPSTQPAGATVRITERDFHIAASVHRVSTGVVALSVHNQGPDDHELIVVKERPGTALPLRRDGVTVDEQRLKPVTIGAGLEPTAPGRVRGLRLDLTPGRYVLFCNMAGHYLGGMHTDLWVSR
jgi:uncharacterized cupredoxin-like copper-binding protein